MLLTRVLPWMNQFQSEMHRLLDEWPTNPALAQTYPAVNVWEDADRLYAEAELPGFDLDKLDIFVAEGNKLTIQGERKPPLAEGTWHRRERGFGRFSRTVVLPCEVQADNVEARFELGVLRLSLPKSEKVKPRRIAVKAE